MLCLFHSAGAGQIDLTPETWTITRVEMTRYTGQQKLKAVKMAYREGAAVCEPSPRHTASALTR